MEITLFYLGALLWLVEATHVVVLCVAALVVGFIALVLVVNAGTYIAGATWGAALAAMDRLN